jgi:protein O-GlcNAc transferase
MLGRLFSSLVLPRRNASALCVRGAELFRAGRITESVQMFEQALACEADSMSAHAGLGAALQKLGKHERAVEHLVRAADDDAAGRGLKLAAAQLLLRLGNAQAARPRLAQLAIDHPDDNDIAYHFGIALREAGEPDAALEHFSALVARRPEHAGAIEAMAALLRDAGLVDEAVELYTRVATLRPESPSAASAVLFHEQYRKHDRAELFRRHVQWAQRHAAPRPVALAPRIADPHRLLTIGYVSADFNKSSAVQFILPIIRGHDRRAFRVACYAASSRRDAVTVELERAADLWCAIDGLDDASARERIEADRVDILVDLNGHTRGSRLGLFGVRSAPVQVTYLGYGATTGVAAMDYRITDPRIDPPTATHGYYVEQLVYLPQTMWCFTPPVRSPAVNRLPAASAGRLTFASLNNFAKVGRECLVAWAEVLGQCPASRIVCAGVPNGAARVRVLQTFRNRGIDESRVLFHSRLSFERFLALHSEIDIALDPFPYSGGATTCNALWMGVPVVTLEGDAVLARSGASLLQAVGLEDWIATSIDDYISKAIRWGAHLPLLAELRAQLRKRVAASPLCDEPAFMRALESAYRDMWGTWCRSA